MSVLVALFFLSARIAPELALAAEALVLIKTEHLAEPIRLWYATHLLLFMSI